MFNSATVKNTIKQPSCQELSELRSLPRFIYLISVITPLSDF